MKHILLSFVLVLIFSFSAFADKCVSGDCANGYGTYIWTIGDYAGDKYIGESKNNLIHGKGTYYYGREGFKGDKYVGEYYDGEMIQGTYYYGREGLNGDKYVGAYKNNMMHGQGTYYYGNSRGRNSGDKYVGGYKNNKMHGLGTYTFADGTISHGIFKNDKVVEKIEKKQDTNKIPPEIIIGAGS